MQISLAQSEHFSNAGFYWTSGEDCADSYTKDAGNAVNQELDITFFLMQTILIVRLILFLC